jgi:hypothetical protein
MRFVPYVYYLRIPLLLAIVLAILPIVGLWSGDGPNPVLGEFFDLSYGEVFVVTLGALLFGAALSIAAALVLLYGKDRFFAAELPASDLENRKLWSLTIPKAALTLIVFFAAAVLLFVSGVIAGVDQEHRIGRLFVALGALGSFAAILFLTAAISNRVSSKTTTFIARRFTWTPFGYLKRSAAPMAVGKWPFEEPPQFLPGHGFAMLMSLVSGLFYLAFAFGRYFYLRDIEMGRVSTVWLPLPTLGSVLMLLGVLCWLLSALGFLLDRYRIPIVVPLAALLIVTAQFPESDHYFEVRNLTDPAALTPEKALRPPGDLPQDTAIVVAASGGGIQAAGWTTQVLTGLVTAGEQAGLHDIFSRSIRGISSVSGGSVGALYFVNAYRDGRIDPGDLQDIVDSSMASSLDDVAWGLVYPDMLRAVAPLVISPRIDRGWALERAWLKHLKVPFESSASLGTWRADARAGRRPAVLFNTTLVETGERFLLSTVDIPPSAGRRSFFSVDGYESHDVSAVTAARLSATFPYVTPVSRARCCPPRSHRYHFADGGYYDNYGLASISELLDQGTRSGGALKRILLIQILLDQPGADPASGGNRGWFFQSFAPLVALDKMRSEAQYSRGETEIDLLQQALAARGITLTRVSFPYVCLKNSGDPTAKCPAPPLSWRLSSQQVSEIRKAWEAYVKDGKRISDVIDFLQTPAKPRQREAK